MHAPRFSFQPSDDPTTGDRLLAKASSLKIEIRRFDGDDEDDSLHLAEFQVQGTLNLAEDDPALLASLLAMFSKGGGA
jgi:hypothetical protein